MAVEKTVAFLQRKMAFTISLTAGILFFSLTAGIASAKFWLRLENNRYESILVAFSPRINQSVGEPLIDHIKELFTNASVALYTATRQRASFKHVVIMVPQEWETREEYRKAGVFFSEADIRIDDPNPEYTDGPYTLQPLGCGSEGLFIHLTPGYLRNLKTTSTKLFGDPGKTLVHEWAHFRYGIFDEFGYPGNPMFPMAYYNGEDLLPNSCTNGHVKGMWKDVVNDAACTFNNETGLPNDDCVFLPSLNENDGIQSSIASYHFLKNVSTFCDDGKEHYHNPIAPNKHNVLCESQSTWSVIQQHKDFANDNNIARPGIEHLKPSFSMFQQMEAIYCLVLDTSGSMGNFPPASNPLRKDILYAAVKRWLQEEVTLGSAVGIVPFASEVTEEQVVPVTKIDTEATRQRLISKIPNRASGGTGIGLGLQRAIELLQSYRKDAPGGIIILVTDGEETPGIFPQIKDVLLYLKRYLIRVITIALHTNQGQNLQQLAKETGGKLFSIPTGAKGAQELGMALNEALTYQTSEFDLAQTIFARIETTFPFGTFVIDSTIGNDTTIDITTAGGSARMANVTISGPNINDDVSVAAYKEPDALPATFVRFKYASLQAGIYEYNITRSKESPTGEIQVYITSKAKSATRRPIVARSWIQEAAKSTSSEPRFVILAEVKQGYNPVIYARVMAKVDRPNNGSVTIQLFDNGSGAPDVTRVDGIYTRYFTKFSGKGRYSVTIEVTDNAGKASIRDAGFTGSRAMRIPNRFQTRPDITHIRTGPFTRILNSGAFDITTDLNEDQIDLFPPSRVSDLHVVYNDEDNADVTLSWTAPGDELDSGVAASYDVRYSTNWTLLSTNFLDAKRIFGINSPLPAGEEETLQFHLPDINPNVLVFVAMQTSDKSGQVSKTSNIVQVFNPVEAATRVKTTHHPRPETTPLPRPATTPLPRPETTPLPRPESTPLPRPETTPLPIPETTSRPRPETTPRPRPEKSTVPGTTTATTVHPTETATSTPGDSNMKISFLSVRQVIVEGKWIPDWVKNLITS